MQADIHTPTTMQFPSLKLSLSFPFLTKIIGNKPAEQVNRVEKIKGIRLSSPGEKQAIIAEIAISKDTNSNEVPIYKLIILPFIDLLKIFDAKIFGQKSFINTIISNFALILSMKDMTLQQLKYIIAIDDYRHFGKAAEYCGLTQSTLSLMVKKLEEELDVKIFDRDTYPISPTEMGRKIIDQAKVVLYHVNQISEITHSEKELLSGPLRIAVISTVSPVLLPGMFKYFGNNYPSISFQTEEMITDTIKDKLRKAEVDMGIVAGPVQDTDLLEIPLYHERFLAYLSEESPLYSKKTISMEDLYGQSIWIIKEGLRKINLSEMEKDGKVTYERFFEGGRVGMLIQIVNENGGITIIPETHKELIRTNLQKGLRPIINPEPTRTVSLLVRSDYIHESMLNAVVKAIKSIIPSALLDSVIRRKHLTI